MVGVLNPLDLVADRLAERYSARTLARATVLLLVGMLLTQSGLAWYVGSLGLSLQAVGQGNDDRTVVLDAETATAFEDHYRSDVEVGWCLYGSANRSHVRVAAAVPANPTQQRADRIEFTCLPETAGRVTSDGTANLVGVAHSHPSFEQSRISRVDAMTWGRLSPLIEVMGIYTEADGVEFFTDGSLVYPLDKRVVGESGVANATG